MNNEIEIPLNIIKEKMLYAIPPGTEIDDEAIKASSLALNYFLRNFARKIRYNDKKILVRDIKNQILEDENLHFLKKLVDK
jgi:hypothetical protein